VSPTPPSLRIKNFCHLSPKCYLHFLIIFALSLDYVNSIKSTLFMYVDTQRMPSCNHLHQVEKEHFHCSLPCQQPM
jgi:hypothetical protein